MNKPHKLPCEKVIEENIGLVKKIVSRFNVSDFNKDDLIQAGLIGLWKAAYHFNESLGYKFSTYAVKYILGEIKKELKNFNMIKVSRKYYQIIGELRKYEKINDEEISKRLGCSYDDIAIAYTFINDVVKINDNEIVDIINDRILSKKEVLIEKVKELSINKNMKQTAIAKELNISQSTVSRIVNEIKLLEKQ